jgi:hypothetical protein
MGTATWFVAGTTGGALDDGAFVAAALLISPGAGTVEFVSVCACANLVTAKKRQTTIKMDCRDFPSCNDVKIVINWLLIM